MAVDLVTAQRAAQSPHLAALSNSNPAYFASLLSTASDAIRRYCAREFTLASRSEYYDGGIYIREPLKLREFPVSEITRIATAQQCLLVQNSGATAQRATIETLSNGDIKLATVASGISATTTLPAATYTTVGTMAAAITAQGHGWSTSIYSGPVGSYNNFPTVDLKPLQGAATAMVGGCLLEIYEDWHGWNSSAYWPDDAAESAGIAPFWRLRKESGEIEGRLPRGTLNLRIDYTAGFNPIPAAIQEACVQLAQWFYQQASRNLTASSVKLGLASATFIESRLWPASVTGLISTYKAHDKIIFGN